MGKIKSLEQRIQHDENAWLKALGEFGDLARLIRDTKAEEAKTRRALFQQVNELSKRVERLEVRLNEFKP